MTLTPARTAKLPADCDLALAWDERLVLPSAHPDVTSVLDLRAWPPRPTNLQGLFLSSACQTSSGRVVAVGRHHHPNPYRLYELDLDAARVTPRPAEMPWREPLAVYALGERVLVVPGGDLHASGHKPAWLREDGALESIALPVPEAPAPVECKGRLYLPPSPFDRVDAAPLGGGEALLVWFEGLYRLGAEGAVKLPLEGLGASWEPLREGRHMRVDALGRAVTVLNDQLVAIDREGAVTHFSPGSERVRAAEPGPDGLWFLSVGESLHLVFTREGEVAELDLRGMRLALRMALNNPKPVWVPSRDALFIAHARDAHEYDLAALRAIKRVPIEKHAAKAAAKVRTMWARKVKATTSMAIPLDALSPRTRGGELVEHDDYGPGVVLDASETIHRGAYTIRARALFEAGERHFYCLGDRWAERRLDARTA